MNNRFEASLFYPIQNGMAVSNVVPKHKLAHMYFVSCDLLRKLARVPFASNRCSHLSCSSYWAPLESRNSRRRMAEWMVEVEDEVL